MKNKTTTYKWAYLPFVFSSAAILATQATAGPSGSQRYQDAKQVSSVNHEYVGGDHSIGFGVDDEGNVDANFDAAISRSDEHRTGVGLWAGYDLAGDDQGVLGRGGQVNHAWVSKNASGQVTHVNKAFAAYDRNEAGHEKATVGYGQENENLFWDGRVSKGLSGNKNTVNGVSDRAYDWGVGASVGKFLPDANARIRAGIDHEWSDKVGRGEKDAKNTTLSAGIEKFFQGTGHSLSLDVAGSDRSGGAGGDDNDVTGRLGYKYDFGGASIYQPDRRYKRVRVEVPGQAVAPKYAQQQQYKKVPTYKTVPTFKNVPVYGNKQVRVATKQLVKSTMELEGQTFFKLNSAKLIPSAQTRLKQIAAQIRKTGYKGSIRITGNTCGLGNARYDQILSERRAKEVRNFLIKHGFNPNHLIARGLGKDHPKYARTPDQDFKNRRVDIEYVSQQQTVKTGYKTENKRVQTGTRRVKSGERRVATGFKNVPAGMKNVMISNGKPGAPRVIWKTEAIPTSPAWIQRALNNTIQHNTSVNTYSTTYGNDPVIENVPPQAVNDSEVTPINTPITLDVLDNDTSNSGSGELTITSVGAPSNGTATLVNGQIVYTPNTDFVGTDSFTYTIVDSNGEIATATATVTVEGVKPEAENDSGTTPVGTPVTLDVLGNDTSNSGSGELTITSVATPSNGTATIVNGQIVYTPNAGFVGTDSFEYTITDSNGDTATAIATVVVVDENKAPVASNDVGNGVCGSTTPISIDVLGNDTDPDGDALTITGFTQPSSGTVTQGTNGNLIYTPDAGSTCGVDDTFEYTISDGNGNESTGTVTFTTGPSDVLPEAQNDSATTDAGTPVSLDVLGNDTSNSGSGELTISSVGTPSNGTATIVNGQIVYVPNAGFSGVDSFTYTITDSNGKTATATATVTVDTVKPVAADDSATTPGSTPVTLDVLDNDTTNSGSNQLTISSVGNPSNGTAAIVNGQIVYTPNAGFSGEDSFTYTITDSNGETATATATVTVDTVKPVAADDSATTPGSTPVTLDVLGNDTTNSGSNQLTISSVGNPSNGSVAIVGGQIVYTPNAGFSGEDSFTYTITDSNGETATATATVTVTVDTVKPVAANDSASTPFGEAVTLPVLGNDTSNSGSNQLTITSVGNPSNGSAAIVNGQIVYTPDAGFSGTDSFTYMITDSNGETASATATVTVGGAPKPVAQNDSATTPEGEAVTLPVLGNDTTNSGSGQLTISSVGNPSNGSATIVNGQIVYTPDAGFSGTDSFTYMITDSNGETATATATVTVTAIPGPKAQNDSATTPEGEAVTLPVLGNDTTNSGSGQLTISSVGNASNGSATIVNGQIVYTPDAGFSGTDSFTYMITDSNGKTATATATVTVVGNKAPVANNDSATTGCAPITINVLGNDTDAEGDALSIVSVNAGNLQYGSAMQSGNQITYQPANTCGKGTGGVDKFSYTITDGNGNTASANVTVTLEGVTHGGNTEANMDDAMISTGETVTLNVLANDSGNGLRIIAVDNPANGNVTFTNNTVTYTATGSGSYTETFHYDIVDANGYNDSAMIIIDVVKGCVAGTKCN